MRRLLVLLLLVSLLTGCAQLGFSEPEVHRLVPNVHASRIDLYNQFGFDLFGRLDAEENRLISPVSIAMALAMVYNGTDGNTKAEMAQTLQTEGIELGTFNQENQALLELLQNSDVTVNIANSIWLRQGLPVKAAFVDRNRAYYDAEVSELDFASAGAADAINDWVKQNTNGLIEKILDSLDPETLACLINATYFQGNWTDQFNPGATIDDVFTTPAGEVTVPFMRNAGSFSYLEDEDLQAIRIPYGEGRWAMYIFLPKDLQSFERQLSSANWHMWLADFKSSYGQLTLPKFELGYETELNEVLQALGMQQAFDPAIADFSQMVDGGCWINKVKHKTFIKVDETGTEAAAVTIAVACGSAQPPTPSFEMKVDRPFFFAIHDQEADTILFMGSVLDPR